MSLDKIIKGIDEKVTGKIAEINYEAQQKKDAVTGKFELKKRENEPEREKKEKAIFRELENSILLPARMEVRGLKLEMKRETINKAFQDAMAVEEEQYKIILDYLAKDLPDINGAEMIPSTGKEEVTEKYFKEKGIKIKLLKAEDLEGGFVIKKGKIDYDCSFRTLLRALRERLEPEVVKIF